MFLLACGSDSELPRTLHPTARFMCPSKRLGEGEIAGQNENPKNKESIVPGEPDRLLLCSYLGLNHGTRSDTLLRRRVVTNPSVVRSIVEEFDDLRPFPRGAFACPNDDGSRTYVLFHHASVPPVLVEVAFTGCWIARNGRSDAVVPTADLRRRLESLATPG